MASSVSLSWSDARCPKTIVEQRLTWRRTRAQETCRILERVSPVAAQKVCTAVRRALEMEKGISPAEDFKDVGVDSMQGATLRRCSTQKAVLEAICAGC